MSERIFATDVDTIADNVYTSLIAGSPSDATVNAELANLKADGSFSNVSYTDTSVSNWATLTHLSQLHDMTTAWCNPSSALYQSASLKTNIQNAYNYWVSGDYQNSNWFYNEISIPGSLGETMLMLQKKGALPTANYSTAIAIVDRAIKEQTKLTAVNLIWTSKGTIYEGAIRYLQPGASAAEQASATTLITNSFNNIGTTFATTTSDGIQADKSYHAHGQMIYDGGYGESWIIEAAKTASIGTGTAYGISATQTHQMIDYLLDGGQQWAVRGANYDPTVGGRYWSRTALSNAPLSVRGSITQSLALGGSYRQTELQAMQTRMNSAASTHAANSALALTGNRAYWTSDYMVQQRPDYMMSVKTVSTRTNTPESINGENLKGGFGYDGVNLIMRSGNEYAAIYPVWDWYRLPGTTSERGSSGIGGSYVIQPNASKGATTFAGGASDGTRGATGFKYSHYNVTANKSWFLFDKEEEVAMGSGISAAAAGASNVIGTNINQTLLNGNVVYSTAAGASMTIGSGQTVTPTNLRWVNHDSVGYFFLTPVNNATIRTLTQSGAWSAINTGQSGTTVNTNVFSLDLSHGLRPTNGNYLYVIVPNIAAGAMDAYLASNPITVLQNDATAQAVTNNTIGVTEATFYAPGRITITPGLTLAQTTAAHGSSLLWKQLGTLLTMSVASPEAYTGTLSFNVSEHLTGANATWNAASGLSTVTFALPSGTSAGSTITQSFTVVPEPAALIGGVGMLSFLRRPSR